MFGKHHMFKLVVAIAVVAAVAFAGAHRAMATRPFITDTLGGGGHPARHAQTPLVVKATCTTTSGWAFTTDNQGNPWLEPVGSPLSLDCGATTPADAQSIQSQDSDRQRFVTAMQNIRAAQIAQSVQSQDSDHQRFVTAMQNIRAAQIAQSIQSQDSEYQRFVTAGRTLRAARAHAFTIITDTLGGNGIAKLLAPGGSRSTMQ